MKRALVGAAAFAALALGSEMAAAQTAEAPPAAGGGDRPVAFSAGARVFLGGNYSNTPGNISPPGYEGIYFAGNSGGFGWGLGAYGEARFVEHLGVELGFIYDNSTLQRDVTYNSVITLNERVTFSSTRLNLLLKGIAPFPAGRMWVGVGPELVLSVSGDAGNEITEGASSTPDVLKNAIRANEEKSTLLALALGMVIHAGDLLEIPIELRALKNMSQESDWLDRVDIGTPPAAGQPAPYAVNTRSTWEFRLGMGLGARF